MASPTSTQGMYTLTEAVQIAFTICYCALNIVFTLLLLVVEVYVAHVILYRVCYGRFPTMRTASSGPTGTKGASTSTSTSRTDIAEKSQTSSTAETSPTSNTPTSPGLLLVTTLNGFILFIIPLLIALMRDSERVGRTGVARPDIFEMGRDFAFGMVPGSMVLVVFVVVEVLALKAWSVVDAYAKKEL